MLLKRTAAEAGLDHAAVSLQEIVRPSLFPDMLWHSAGGALAAVVNQHDAAPTKDSSVLLVKQEDTTTMGDPPDAAATLAPDGTNGDVKIETPSNVVIPLNKIKRPSNVTALMNKQRDLWRAFSKSSHYIRPAQHVDVVRYSATRPTNALFARMLEDERYVPPELLRPPPAKPTSVGLLDADNVDDSSKNEQAEEGDEAVNEEVEDVEDDDEVEDYTTNYYASDDDDDDGSGGEATF